MLLHSCIQLKALEDGGHGLFATANIEKGEIIWEEARESKTQNEENKLHAKARPSRPGTFEEVVAMPQKSRDVFTHFGFQVDLNFMESSLEYDLASMEDWPSVKPSDPAQCKP
jgi:hypothetical protein